MRISDWSSDVCSSDLHLGRRLVERGAVDDRIGGGFVLHQPIVDAVLVRQRRGLVPAGGLRKGFARAESMPGTEIGRASCRERVCQYVYILVVAVSLKKKKQEPQKYN